MHLQQVIITFDNQLPTCHVGKFQGPLEGEGVKVGNIFKP